MELLPLSTGILHVGDDLVAALLRGAQLRDGDIVVVSSKAVATVEGAAYDLAQLTPSEEANELAATCGKSPHFREAMLREIKRLNGRIVRKNRFAILTEVMPDGMEGSILVASAGLDESNAGEGKAIGWPRDPVRSVDGLRSALQAETGKKIAVIITDSCCRPRRLGVTAFALTAAGVDPLQSLIGTPDLFGHALHVTREARADQLAVAANFLMGNSAQAMPGVIVREHGLALTDFLGWVPGIHEEEDMFAIG